METSYNFQEINWSRQKLFCWKQFDPSWHHSLLPYHIIYIYFLSLILYPKRAFPVFLSYVYIVLIKFNVFVCFSIRYVKRSNQQSALGIRPRIINRIWRIFILVVLKQVFDKIITELGTNKNPILLNHTWKSD